MNKTKKKKYTPMIWWKEVTKCFWILLFLFILSLFFLLWNISTSVACKHQAEKTHTPVCIPWRNYQSLTDCLIDKSHFENTSRQIERSLIVWLCACLVTVSVFNSIATILLPRFDLILKSCRKWFKKFFHYRLKILTAFYMFCMLEHHV